MRKCFTLHLERWLAAGSIAVVIGVRLRPGVLPTRIGLLALGYGWLWARVARTGQRQRWALRRRPRDIHLH